MYRFWMSKPAATMARNKSLKGQEEHTLRSVLCCQKNSEKFWDAFMFTLMVKSGYLNDHCLPVSLNQSVRQSITVIFYTAYPLWLTRKLEPIPANFGLKVGYTLDRSAIHRSAEKRRTTMFSSNQFGRFCLTLVIGCCSVPLELQNTVLLRCLSVVGRGGS